MRKSKRRKLEKKRRFDRQRRLQGSESLAYHGNKYKNNKWVPLIFQTEIGIYESFVMSGRELTDHDVRAALESLIRGIRGGWITIPPQQLPDGPEDGSTEGLIVWNIQGHWQEYAEREPSPSRDNLIGVLRTILGSIEVWGNISPTSRGYLRYLEGFMSEAGVRCREVPPEVVADLEDGTVDLDDLPDEEENDDALLLAGRAWANEHNAHAGVVFHALAEEMISVGEAKDVSEACQQLMGETRDRRIIDELGVLSIRAQQHLQPPRSLWRSALGRLIGG